jgi:hypothetical protein
MMSYRSSLAFVPTESFWPNYCPWILEFYIVFKLLFQLNATVLLDI